MKVVTLTSLLICVSPLASCLNVRLAGPGDTNTTQPMTWTGSLADGLDETTIIGTVEEVVAMKKIQDPGYAAREDAAAFAAHPLLAIRDSPIARADCDGDDFIKAKVLADQAWIHPIEDGIRHLKEVGGTCGCGPRACCRISCSWEAAVHFCNDNDFPFAYSCYDLGAWFLQHLNNHCRQTGAFGIKYCGGRVWPKGGSWTLTLQRDQCW